MLFGIPYHSTKQRLLYYYDNSGCVRLCVESKGQPGQKQNEGQGNEEELPVRVIMTRSRISPAVRVPRPLPRSHPTHRLLITNSECDCGSLIKHSVV